MGITFRPQQLPPPRGLMLSRWETAALTQTWSSTPTTTPTVPAACQTMWSSPVPTNSTSTRSSWGRISVPRRTKVSVSSPVYRYHGGIQSYVPRQTGVIVSSPVYRYQGGGMQSYVSRRTEVSVSLPLFRCEGKVSSVWTVLPREGLTVKGEVIYINCLICNLSSCEYGIWFTVERGYWLRQSFIQDLQDIFIDIILLVMCDLCSSPRGFYIIYLLLVPMIFVVQHLPVTCDPWCTTLYLLPIIL